MIVEIEGKVQYPITLDPTVWIFDDRKVLLEEAFKTESNEDVVTDELEQASLRFDREVYQQKVKPPVTNSIAKYNRKELLENSYVMPIRDFLNTAEIKPEANSVELVSRFGNETISIDQLRNSLLLFSNAGKPLYDDGPIHLYFKDGSNQESPIKGISRIILK
ncbi:hypothetical protein KO561_08180 [Radiobacillus kanasensis]|uniref:hypothetical protein n=1 Tax=Radiobacillus kanasensis TaxID=2844358 RepID=UPI001E5F5C04|nr:hypothetical protein [Radiobacillus kanasensis]UFU00898.1 hypothetical protein KO561_08180 [Radiobacillus kanasensis]